MKILKLNIIVHSSEFLIEIELIQNKMCYLSQQPCQQEHLVSLPWIQVQRKQQIQPQNWFHCWADTTGRCP